MAVKWSEDSGVVRKAHGYAVLPENVLIIPELSGRMDATDIEDLAKDIETNGQLEHGVCWKNNDGWPVLAAGHRRYRAIRSINDRRKPEDKIWFLFIHVDAKNEMEAFDYTVRENRNRINPSPLDDAINMHVYQTRFGLNEEQIAHKYYPGMTNPEEIAKAVREVKNTLALLELSPEAQEEMRKGFISTSAALQLAAIPSRNKQNEVIQDAKDKGKKKLKVEDAKAAKEDVVGLRPRKNIADNTPSKLLIKYKILAEFAGALAAENLNEDPDMGTIMDLSRTILVRCKALNVPMLPGLDKKIEKFESKYPIQDDDE